MGSVPIYPMREYIQDLQINLQIISIREIFMNKWIQLTLLLFPAICTAECIEFKIVDHGSYVEAV